MLARQHSVNFLTVPELTFEAGNAIIRLSFLRGAMPLNGKRGEKMAVDMSEIKRNSDWYYANQDSLVPKYDGKFIAIIDCAVVGEYDTFANGVHAMLNAGHRPGTFIVHHCLTPEEEKRMYFFYTPRMNFVGAKT